LKRKYLWIAGAAAVGIAAFLLLKSYLLALLMAGVVFLLWWSWKMILDFKDKEIKRLSDKLDQLHHQNDALAEELHELRQRRWNVSDIKHILDLGIMQINTSFTRTWDKKFVHDNKDVHFIGALKVKVTAQYGIDLKELQFKYDPSDKILYIANLQPKLLSFKDINYIWEIAEILEYKKPFIGSNYWRKSKELQELGAQIKEELRLKTHEEVKKGPEEMQWILEPIKTHLVNTVEWLFNYPGVEVKIIDRPSGEGFLPLEEFFTGNPFGGAALPRPDDKPDALPENRKRAEN